MTWHSCYGTSRLLDSTKEHDIVSTKRSRSVVQFDKNDSHQVSVFYEHPEKESEHELGGKPKKINGV